jgi:hypothetical protein
LLASTVPKQRVPLNRYTSLLLTVDAAIFKLIDWKLCVILLIMFVGEHYCIRSSKPLVMFSKSHYELVTYIILQLEACSGLILCNLLSLSSSKHTNLSSSDVDS